MSKPNRFVSPATGLIGAFQNGIARAAWLRRFRRAVMRHLPFLRLASDVHDVVYFNWLVPVSAVHGLIPPGIEIEERGGFTVLTVLTYRHGHFGPAVAGGLRGLFPSPLQSNWRLYVRAINDARAERTVLFVRNIFDSALYALGTRLFSDALPSHLAERFRHEWQDGVCTTTIAGGGSAPSFDCAVEESADPDMPAGFERFFADRDAAISFLCLQDAAVCAVDDVPGALALAMIDLPIDPAGVQALRPVRCEPGSWLQGLVGATGAPFCFLVPKTPFSILSERLIR